MATQAEIVKVLYQKLCRGHSWDDFCFYMKGRVSKRAAQNVLSDLRPPNYELRPMGVASRMAATFLFAEITELMLEYHRTHLVTPTAKLMIKLWWDERRIKGALQTVGGLSPLWPRVPKHNSWIHFLPIFMLGKGSKDAIWDTLEDCGLHQALREYHNRDVEVANYPASRVSFHVVLDWMCFYELSQDCHSPNSTVMHQRLCPCCIFDVGDKLGGWLRDPFYRHKRLTSRKRALRIPGLDLQGCLYDPMHGLARLLANVISAILSLLKCLALTQELRMLGDAVAWMTEKSGQCNVTEAKQFLSDLQPWLSWIEQIPLDTRGLTVLMPQKDGSQSQTTFEEYLRNAVTSVAVFRKVIYSSVILQEDFEALTEARDYLCSTLAMTSSQMNPALHYMLNHFEEDLCNMLPVVPRDWICEGEEAANAHHRKMSNATVSGALADQTEMSLTEMMLSHAIDLHFLRLVDPDLK
jgi:hypothetical protein